jgi:hypothetical protein
MKTRTPIERTTRIASTVETLTEAWAFVMEHVDTVGPDPSIKIDPVWSMPGGVILDDEAPWPRHFSVVVSGMVEDKDEND